MPRIITPLLILLCALVAALVITSNADQSKALAPNPSKLPAPQIAAPVAQAAEPSPTIIAPASPTLDCNNLKEDLSRQDLDNDGLTNREECFWGTAPSAKDTDQDNYTDIQEVLAGYDPLRVNGMLDSDHDGIADPIEKKAGTDALNPDTDHDGYADGSELQHGYNPLIASPDDKLADHPLDF